MAKTHDETRLTILKHFTTPGYPAALITAFRHEFSYATNVARNYELANLITRSGFGRIWVVGIWRAEGADPREDAALLIIGDRDRDQKLKDFLIATCHAPQFALNGFVFKTSQCRTEIIDAHGKSIVADGNDAPIELDVIAVLYERLRSGPDPDESCFTFLKTVAPASLILRMMSKEHHYDNPRKIPAHLVDQ